MSSALSAVLALALGVCAFVPFGPHVLVHALDIGHGHEHDSDASDSHHHELQSSPDAARIASSRVRLEVRRRMTFVAVGPSASADSEPAPAPAARGLDPPRAAQPPHASARRSGNRAPPAA